MKVKRYLKKRAQEDLKSIETDSDRELLQRLKNSVVKKHTRKEGVMKKRFFILLAFICSLLIVFSLVGCSVDEPCEGTVVKKEFVKGHTDIQLYPNVIYSGTSLTTVLTPVSHYYPDQ